MDDGYLARLTSALGGDAAPACSSTGGVSLTVVSFSAVGSTMDEARDWRGPASNCETPRCACFWPDDSGERLDAVCFLAREQSAGRGREGRGWSSERDRGIYATFLFSPSCGVGALSGYSLVVGLALQRALQRFGVTPIVKWPNDLVVQLETGEFRKLGGVLVDSSGAASGPIRLSVGVGINILPLDSADEGRGLGPIALAEIVGRPVDTLAVFREVAVELLRVTRDFFARGFGAFQERWNSESGFVGREVTFSPLGVAGEALCRGVVLGVDLGGGIRIAHEGRERVYLSGSLMPVAVIDGSVHESRRD